MTIYFTENREQIDKIGLGDDGNKMHRHVSFGCQVMHVSALDLNPGSHFCPTYHYKNNPAQTP